MRVRFYDFGFVLVLLTLSSCQSTEKPNKKVSDFLSALSFEKLIPIWKKLPNNISDSGTIQNEKLNLPDTVWAELGDGPKMEVFFRNFLKLNGPDSIVFWVKRMESHGLLPEFYHSDFLNRCRLRIESGAWSEGERLPYDSLSRYILFVADALAGMQHDLGCGRILPDFSGSVYGHKRRIVSGSRSILYEKMPFQILRKTEPAWAVYKQTQVEYARLQKQPDVSGESKLSLKKNIKPGESADKNNLLLLARRLKLQGYLLLPDSTLMKMQDYNENLSKAVVSMQLDYGVKPTGTLDEFTLSKLNLSKSRMLNSLRADLERMRWLGNVDRPNRIWVNVAANQLIAFRNDSLIVQMRTCSGEPRGSKYYERLKKSKEKNSKVMPPDNLETPLFSAPITHFVINPTWHVPRNILVKEMLPELRRNPEMLNKLGYIIRDKKGNIISAKSINWEKLSAGKVDFSIEQTTGDDNSLGKVVIYILNPYSIFLHDTPSKWAFGLDERHVSHGCIRLEQPFKLVEFLTSFNKKNNYDQALIAAGMPPEHDEKLLKKWKAEQKQMKDSGTSFKREQDKRFNLDSTLPVYVVYFTTSITNSSKFIYYKDSYRYNELMWIEMQKPGRMRLKMNQKK